jgi:hypothetical protein
MFVKYIVQKQLRYFSKKRILINIAVKIAVMFQLFHLVDVMQIIAIICAGQQVLKIQKINALFQKLMEVIPDAVKTSIVILLKKIKILMM